MYIVLARFWGLLTIVCQQ